MRAIFEKAPVRVITVLVLRRRSFFIRVVAEERNLTGQVLHELSHPVIVFAIARGNIADGEEHRRDRWRSGRRDFSRRRGRRFSRRTRSLTFSSRARGEE